MANLLTDHFSN